MTEIPPAVFINDLKDEISPILEQGWKQFDVNVKLWAPAGSSSKLFSHTNYNFLEAPIDCYWNDDHATENIGAFFRSQLDITNPAPAPDAMNVFFSANGRRAAQAIGSELIINEPEIATHAEIFKIASDPPRAKELMRKGAMRKFSEHDLFANDSTRACKAVLSACEGKNQHHFADFLSYVSNPLVAFDESGYLGQSGRHAVERLSDIRKGSKPEVIVCSIPLSHLSDMRIPISLFANAIFTAIKMHPHGRAVHAILDEFTALNLPNFHKEIITLRGLGCTSEVYVQSKHALADATSDKAEATIFDQSDIVTYSAITDYKVASEISSMIGSTSKKGFSANVGDRFSELSFGVQDVDVPLITPQALMALPKDMQLIFVRGMRPIKAKKLPYWDLKGFREFTSDNPLEGPMPASEAKVEIKINKQSVDVIWPKVPETFFKATKEQNSFLKAINPASFLWLLIAFPLYLSAIGWFNIPLPALRTHYTYSGSYSAPRIHRCQYIALNGARFRRATSQCSLISWDYRVDYGGAL